MNGNRIYDSESCHGNFDGYNPVYGEWFYAIQYGDPNHDYHDYTPGEIGDYVLPGEYMGGNMAGYNGSNEILYQVPWETDTILAAISEPLYKDIPITMYRYRSINKTPVEYN